MILFRLLSVIVLALALMFLGGDALDSLEREAVTLRSTAEGLGLIPGVDAEEMARWPDGLPGWIAPFADFVMQMPAWGFLGAVGLILGVAFRGGDDD